MRIFEIIPERFFSILSAQKKELYVDAFMVLRTAFKTELLIRRPELFSMMPDSLEDSFLSADFSEEAMEIGEEGESRGRAGISPARFTSCSVSSGTAAGSRSNMSLVLLRRS